MRLTGPLRVRTERGLKSPLAVQFLLLFPFLPSLFCPGGAEYANNFIGRFR